MQDRSVATATNARKPSFAMSYQRLDECRSHICSVIVVRLAGPVFIGLRQAIAGVQLLFLRLASGIKDWALCLDCHADCMSTVWRKSVRGRMILSYVRIFTGGNKAWDLRICGCPRTLHRSSAIESGRALPGLWK